MRDDTAAVQRDVEYFLNLYAVAVTASFLDGHPVIKTFIAMPLFLAYGSYVLKFLRCENDACHPIEVTVLLCSQIPRFAHLDHKF